MATVERELLALVTGYRIRQARINKGLSQGDLAQGIGSQSMISLFEGGKQLPPSDVLHLIAKRLDDSVLYQHALLLESGQLTLDAVSESNHDILLDILRTRRGRWEAMHGQIAIQLCYHYYINEIFEIVQEISRMVIQNLPTDAVPFSSACFYLGSCYLFEQRYTDAERWLCKAEEYADDMEASMLGRLMYNLGYLYTCLDVQGLALWYAKNAVQVFKEMNDFSRYGKALGLMGVAQSRLGRHQDALQTLELCYSIVTKWGGTVIDRGRIETSLANAYATTHNWVKAEELAKLAISSCSETGDGSTLSSAYYVLYLVHSQAGRMDEARVDVDNSVKIAQASDDIPTIAQSLLLSISFLATREEKMQTARQVYELTLKTNLNVEHALAAESLAGFYEQAKQHEEARHYEQAALHAYRQYMKRNSIYETFIQLLPLDEFYDS